ncbi:hypothetical protein LINPERHAP1_LOCUS760, partial [Linum perenne]
MFMFCWIVGLYGDCFVWDLMFYVLDFCPRVRALFPVSCFISVVIFCINVWFGFYDILRFH